MDCTGLRWTLPSQPRGHARCDSLLAQIRPLYLREGNIHLLIRLMSTFHLFSSLACLAASHLGAEAQTKMPDEHYLQIAEAKWRSEDRKWAGPLEAIKWIIRIQLCNLLFKYLLYFTVISITQRLVLKLKPKYAALLSRQAQFCRKNSSSHNSFAVFSLPRGVKLPSPNLPLPIFAADSRLNYRLINIPHQLKDWWPSEARNQRHRGFHNNNK